MSDLKFRATVDSKKGEVSLTDLDKGVDKVAKTTTRAGAGFKKLAIGIAAGVAAFAIATRALQGLVRWTGESIKGAIDAEKAEKKLEAVLKSTGHAASLTKDELVEMAKALQAVTTFEDDVIMGAEHLLLTFTKIGKDIFPEALETVLDMSQAMGTDLRGASIQLGKALQDPILGATALRRVGVNLSASMMDQIKTFVDSGKIMEAQKLILAELATEFGGTARAVTDTFGGSLIQLKNTWRELQDEVGEAIIGNEAYRNSIKDLSKEIRELIETGKIREWAADAFLHISVLSDIFGKMKDDVHRQLGPLRLLKDAIAGNIGGTDTYAEAMRKLKEALERAGIKKITTEIEEQSEAMLTAAERTAIFTSKADLLAFSMEDVWRALRPPSEIMEEWDRLFALVETPELDLQMEQFAIATEDNFAQIMESMGFFVREAEGLGEGWNDALEGMTAAQLEFSSLAIRRFMAMEVATKNFVENILGVFEDWAIGALIPTIMEALPFPANLLAVGGAVLFIKSWFAALKPKEGIEGKQGGGWVGLGGPEIIKVGERGPEFVTKNSDIKNVFNQAGKTINITIIVRDQLDPYTSQRITREQIIPQILESLDINENKIKFRERLGI